MPSALSVPVTDKGFTVTELLVSVAIVAILSAIALHYGSETVAHIRAIFE